MKKRKRHMFQKALAVILTVITTISCTACGSGKQESAADGDGNGRSIDTIHILMEAVPDTTYVQEATAKFTEETGVAVEIEAVNYQTMHEKIVTEMTADKSSYDVVICDHTWIGEFAEAGWVIPLDDYIAESGFDTSVYLDSVVNMMSWASDPETPYFIPFCTYTYALLYRTDVFENAEYAAAYEEATGESFGVPSTVKEYVEVAKFLTDYTGGELYGAAMQAQRSDPITMEYTNFLFGNGGDYYDEAGNVTINSPEAVQALEYYVDCVNNAAPEGSAGFGFDETLAVFSGGNAAMYIGNYWMIPQLEGTNVEGKVYLTDAPGGHSNNGGWGWGIPHNAKDRNTSWEFIKYIESFEVAKERAIKGGSPTRSDVFGDEEVLAAWPYYEDALNLIANAKALPRTPELPQILEILGRELSEAVAGSKTPKEALDIVAKEMQ